MYNVFRWTVPLNCTVTLSNDSQEACCVDGPALMVQRELHLTAHHSISMAGIQLHKSAPAWATSWDGAKGWLERMLKWRRERTDYTHLSSRDLPDPPSKRQMERERTVYFCDVYLWIVNAFELADRGFLSLSWLIRPKGRNKREDYWERDRSDIIDLMCSHSEWKWHKVGLRKYSLSLTEVFWSFSKVCFLKQCSIYFIVAIVSALCVQY